jgi:mRNA-degrading endonuclease RelE of RelBE toxin-antitoxin system
MAEFIETVEFTRKADKLLTPLELNLVQKEIAFDPTRGAVIQGTGGARKLRVALPSKGKGKRGGARVVYYYQDSQGKVYLIDLYTKSRQSDLSEAQKQRIYQFVKAGLDDE